MNAKKLVKDVHVLVNSKIQINMNAIKNAKMN